MIRRLLLVIALLLPVPLPAQEADETPEAERDNAEASSETTTARTEDSQPDAGSLRRREISEAFQQFKPSEEISADNAVPFPVDI